MIVALEISLVRLVLLMVVVGTTRNFTNGIGVTDDGIGNRSQLVMVSVALIVVGGTNHSPVHFGLPRVASALLATSTHTRAH